MTIAQLYRHLTTTNFPHLRATEKITMLMSNSIVRITSRTEAEEYAFCINYVPTDILAEANHCWALELSYVARMPEGHPARRYLHTELLNGYRRIASKDRIKIALQALHRNFDQYQNKPLWETITELHNFLTERRAEATRGGEPDNRAPTTTPEPPTEDSMRPPIATPAEIQNARDRLQDAYMDDRNAIARAVANSLNMPGQQPAPQVREKIPLKDVVAFCNANELFRYRSYDPFTKKHKITFITPEKAKKIQAILEAEATTEQTQCSICMSAEGTLSCGVGNCAGHLCGDCFFTWYHKNAKCPCCRAEFISISARSRPSPAVATQEQASDNDE